MKFVPLMFLMGPIFVKSTEQIDKVQKLVFPLQSPTPLPLLCFLFVTVFPQDVFRTSSASLFLLGFVNESVLWQRKKNFPITAFHGTHTYNAALICQVYGCQSLALICMNVLCFSVYALACIFACSWQTEHACAHAYIP